MHMSISLLIQPYLYILTKCVCAKFSFLRVAGAVTVGARYLGAACVDSCGGQTRSFGDDLLQTET